ncbi:MAG TPA: hypothetical protein VJG83_05155 [archaeon]|nr:hypothetical protein [archaeon]
MKNSFYWIEKAIYLAIGFAATIFFLYLFKIWGVEKNSYFLFVGDLESVIIVLATTFAIGLILEKLWKWEVRSIFKPRQANSRGDRKWRIRH